MRKFLTFTAIAVCIITSCCKAQYVDIPDTAFRSFLISQYPGCFNSAGQMDTTCSAIVNETHLSCGTALIPLYQNFDGVQYFKSLTYFNCVNQYADLSTITLANTIDTLACSNNLKGPSVFPASLKYLNCSNCNYTELPPLPAGLKTLSCIDNTMLHTLPPLPQGLTYLDCYNSTYPTGILVYLTSLPPLPDSLEFLNCSNNSLTSLPPLPAALKKIDFSYNSITGFDAFPSGLTEIQGYANQLTSLPALPASLEKLYVYSNNLTSLPALPARLKELVCATNNLTSMPALPDSLFYFVCGGNQLTSLPDLPPTLGQLKCGNNLLTSLPELPSSLFVLECFSNRLTSLPELAHTSLWTVYCCYNDIHCLPWLPAGCTVVLDTTKIKCLPNNNRNSIYVPLWGVGDIYPAILPLCTPVNNINQCHSFPVMQGIGYYDNNNNGTRENNEPVKKNYRIDLSNNAYTFTNKEGFFEIATDSIGSYTLHSTPPNYFNTTPSQYNYNFSRYDTLVNGNFTFTTNNSIDMLSLKVTPVNWAARPGFSFPYLISYENIGTTTLSPTITFDYDQSRLNYDSSSAPGIMDNADLLSYNTGTFVPGQSGEFIAYFHVNPSATIGDTLTVYGKITAGTLETADTNIVGIRGSFDPNDKQATPQLSPSQVANGEYIDYTIRFQNTGTDTAFNIVITDTLNANLKANTLQLIASSHNCKATVKGNVVYFEFLSILLPDSNTNELKSHGFVSFRIQPEPTVSVNSTIPNKAAIYFDYNVPVITNTANTLIKIPDPVPLKLISFSTVPQNDNTTALYWSTANEINTKHFVIERGNDGYSFNAITSVIAKGRMNNNYSAVVADANAGIIFYRLKMVDNDGSFTYSPIIKIDKRKNIAGVSVLTNPVKGYLIINTTDKKLDNKNANIINMQGAVVKSFIIKEGTQTIEVKDLPAGIYYLTTMNGSSMMMIR